MLKCLLYWLLLVVNGGFVLEATAKSDSYGGREQGLLVKSQCANLKRNEIEPHLSTKTPYRVVANLDDKPIIYPGCHATRIWSLIRHGTRNPSKKHIEEAKLKLVRLKEQILLNPKTKLCPEELARLRLWHFNVSSEEEKYLTPEGEEELIALAERMQNRFPDLLPDQYYPSLYYFKYTKTQRTLKSAQSFTTGLFGRHAIGSIEYPEALHQDPVLRSFYQMDSGRNYGRLAASFVIGGGGSGGNCAGALGSSSRKTSMSDSQQMLPILQQLTNGSFGIIVPDKHCPLCFQAKRHQEKIEGIKCKPIAWRIRERMKTASVVLVLCLNIGVDPPDVVKIQPCARLECWVDPSSVSAPKAMELIGNNLQMQYERWQPRARYKKCHDPTAEDVKKLCTSLRRNAKGERILFHYNGHGVPKPTANGEIWVFNKTFTQYIPLSIFELQSWMGAPSIYVYDCSNAGIIINSFQQFAEQHERDLEKSGQRGGPGQPPSLLTPFVSYKNCIHLAACSVNEILPMNANLPADLFTSCLTTPINIALKWYTMQEKFELVPIIQSEQVDKIPGKVNDRRTMMGELNWIFTAITDTIAWNTLPRDLFQRLFRQDLLVASLFRNFLLAERILRSHDCTPVSHPALPPCFRHHMWSAWDLVVDYALQQLPEILEKGAPYRQLPFFEQQLTAFQVWLDRESESRSPPEQLPIVLQVLLSQVHRLRALELLARFLDLGPWAVNLALGVGIFPYVLKLLQSSAKELRPVLVFIWAKILAVDPNCQVDLVKEHKYFLSVLQDTTVSKEHRTLSAFVLACIVNDFLLGKTSALQGSLVSICLEQLNDESWLLRQWLAICLGMLWQNFEKARWSGVRDLAHEKLYPLLKDPIPEVRAAAVFALGTFISSVTDREEHANNIDRIIAITLLDTVGEDMSPLVRLELAAALQWMVLLFESQFVTVYMQEQMSSSSPSLALTTSVSGSERSASVSHSMTGAPIPAVVHHSTHSLERHVSMRRGASSSSISNMVSTAIPFQAMFLRLWQGIYNLGHDPFPEVAETAQKIIAYVRDKSVDLITAKEATSDKCNSSVSLPPSPSTRGNFLSGESPPVGAGVQVVHQNASNWANKLRNNKLLAANVMNNAEHQTLLQRKLRTTSMGDETDSCPPLNGNRSAGLLGSGIAVGGNTNLNINAGGSSGGGEGSHSARSSTSESNYEPKSTALKPILQTEFISWANSYFMRPGKNRYASAEGSEGQQVFPADTNSPELRSRHFRFCRNELLRRQSKEQHMRGCRIDTQTCMLKTQHTPAIVKLLPYETQVAVAYKEKVLVYDWVRNSVRSYVPQASSNHLAESGGQSSSPSAHMQHHQQQYLQQQLQSLTARVSAIEFLNAHDIGLILAGHEDGVVRVWQPGTEDQPESQLITAFEGIPAMNAAYTSSYGGGGGSASTGSGSGSSSLKHRRDLMRTGIVTAWQQCRQHLVVGGGISRFLRIWDVERELKHGDIPIGSETCVRVLAPFAYNLNSSIVVAGCADGSVRLFDKRLAPQDARICVFREHVGAILSVCLKENHPTLVTGCAQGRVRIFDLRQAAAVSSWEAGSDVAVIASHPSADIVACGSAQGIALHQESGRALNTLRGTEGFMGTKIGYPTCLSFHSYKAALAVGCVDNTVVVYEPAAEFYKLCKRWKIDVDKNPKTFDNSERFLHEPEMIDAINFIRRRTQVKNITAEEAKLIYTICGFETAWDRRRDLSVWCNLFNRDTIKAFEFFEDLEYYWNDGYGYELTHRMACAAMENMFEHIDPNSNKPNATFYFTHSGTLLKVLAHLGLYKDEKPLTYRDFKRERAWRTSKIDAFATNLAFVLYECSKENGSMVLTLHQERPIRLPGCPQDQDLCSLKTLKDQYTQNISNCNLQEMCHIERDVDED